MSDLDERIARGLALREQHPDWSPRTVLAALDHGEDSPEVHDSIERTRALMEYLTPPPITKRVFAAVVVYEQTVEGERVEDSERVFFGDPWEVEIAEFYDTVTLLAQRKDADE